MEKMKLKNILFINHSPSTNTIKLSNHIEILTKELNPEINLISLNPFETKTNSFQSIDGVLIGTTENFGYMAGATKDFFDRCYEKLIDKTDGLPVFYYIRAGLDGEGSQVAINKILKGLKWKQVLPPLILKGAWSNNFLDEVEEKALIFINGIEMGIY
jgi:multimeric flavodoxin WrbA